MITMVGFALIVLLTSLAVSTAVDVPDIEVDTEPGVALNCPVEYKCGGTGDNCVDSCSEVDADGDYQSCDRCNGYISCTGPILFERRCAYHSLKWDDTSKSCEYNSNTCTCPLYEHFEVNMRNGSVPQSLGSFFWHMVPDASATDCSAFGVLQVTPLPCVSLVTIHMTFEHYDSAGFHIAGCRQNDGTAFRKIPPFCDNDAEMFSFGVNQFGSFVSGSGGYKKYFRELDTSGSICIQLRPGKVHVDGDLSITLVDDAVLDLKRSFYIGVNRVLNDAVHSTYHGSGMCSLTVDWSC